jgi:hypothetical protein
VGSWAEIEKPSGMKTLGDFYGMIRVARIDMFGYRFIWVEDSVVGGTVPGCKGGLDYPT